MLKPLAIFWSVTSLLLAAVVMGQSETDGASEPAATETTPASDPTPASEPAPAETMPPPAPVAPAEADAGTVDSTPARVVVIPLQQQVAKPVLYVLRRGLKDAIEQKADMV